MHIKTHNVIGASAVVLIVQPTLTSLIPCLMFSIIGSTIVDTDHQYIAEKSVFPTLAIIFPICYYLNLFNFDKKPVIGLIMFSMIIMIFYNSGHRNISHSFLGLILASIPIYFINQTAILSFALGYCFHLFADSFTKTGVKFFSPYDTTPYGLRIINMHTTGDFPFFITSLLILTILLMYNYNLVSILNRFNNILNTLFFNFS